MLSSTFSWFINDRKGTNWRCSFAEKELIEGVHLNKWSENNSEGGLYD